MTTHLKKRRRLTSPSSSPPRLRPGAPELILAIALTLSLVAAYYVASTTSNSESLQFEAQARQTEDSIRQHVGVYTALLNGARGLLAAKNGQIDRASFGAYADQLGAPMSDSGIVGLGYIQRVLPGTEATLIATMHAQGYPHFQLQDAAKPPVTPGPALDRFAILYLVPETATNQRGIGMNTFSDPLRRAAMEEARDTGRASASERVVSLQPTPATVNKPIFLIYLPIYRGGVTPASLEERRSRLLGFVYCPFHSDDMLRNTLEQTSRERRLDVDVFDGTELDDSHLLYRSNATAGEKRQKGSGADTDTFHSQKQLDIAGRPWTVVCYPGARFGEIQWAPSVLIFGVAISGLMFGIARAQSRARTDAEYATTHLRRSDAALRASEARARRLIESNIIGVLRADFKGHVLEANDALLHLSGWTRDELDARAITLQGLTPSDMARGMERALGKMRVDESHPPFETALLRRDGTRVPVMLGATRVEGDPEKIRRDDESGDQFIAFLLDITERKDAERQLRDNEARQRAFFRDVLSSVTEGRLRLCDSPADLPYRADSVATSLTKPALRAVRHAAQRAARAAAMPEERTQDLITAVGEATMNAVVHAGGGTAYVSNGENGTVQVWIEDHGRGIDMQRLPKATLERGYTTAGSLGHGFWLMLKTVDRLWLLTSPQGTTVVIEQDAKALEPLWITERMGVIPPT